MYGPGRIPPVGGSVPATRPVAPASRRPGAPVPPAAVGQPSFQRTLEKVVETRQPVKISGHARQRLAEGRHQLSEEDMQRLSGAVDQAAAKGSRESLILMSDLALVVSVKNRTVITAIGGERIRENVFTNIDSAVIL